ncbi:hypothetical protein GCM10009577_46560 [Streptomyces javensis]
MLMSRVSLKTGMGRDAAGASTTNCRSGTRGPVFPGKKCLEWPSKTASSDAREEPSVAPW